MHTIGALVMWIGLILLLVGGVMFLISAFSESILWGLGVLFVPFVSLAFLILHWGRAKDSFFMQLWGIVLVVLGVLAFKAHLPLPHWH